jgi:acetoacetate decarboxylase
MTAVRPELSGVAGVPETLVSDALLARLPANDAPAPWTVRSRAVIWYARGGAAATAALPPSLRNGHRGLAVVGGVVRYSETPVGPYDEVFGLVGAREGRGGFGTVSFMSVDSEASLVGGRANWGMPKTLGAFDGEIGSGRTMTARGADAVGWRVTVTPRVLGPRLPFSMRATTRQELAGGRIGDSRLDGRARVRPALVKVDVESEGDLATWLRPGWHLGAVVEECSFSLAAPSFG